jgi:3-oxoacyl-[acyl-carrier protein] reductase
MVERRYGKIINISSICGRGGSLEDTACYCASKAGVIQLTKNAAYELGEYGIGVNCVAPGLIITPMVHRGRSPEQLEQLIDDRKRVAVVGRVGDPQDIANVALFLASEDSSFINGQTVPVDGGRIDRM